MFQIQNPPKIRFGSNPLNSNFSAYFMHLFAFRYQIKLFAHSLDDEVHHHYKSSMCAKNGATNPSGETAQVRPPKVTIFQD